MVIYNVNPSFSLKRTWLIIFILIAIVNGILFYKLTIDFEFVLLIALLFTVIAIAAIIVITDDTVISINAFFNENYIQISAKSMLGKTIVTNVPFQNLTYEVWVDNNKYNYPYKVCTIKANRKKIAQLRFDEKTKSEKGELQKLIDNLNLIVAKTPSAKN